MAQHDGHPPLRCHEGCPAYAEYMAEMHDQMQPPRPRCPYLIVPQDVHAAMLRAQRERDPAAVTEAAKGLIQCEREPHEDHDHHNGDTHWSTDDHLASRFAAFDLLEDTEGAPYGEAVQRLARRVEESLDDFDDADDLRDLIVEAVEEESRGARQRLLTEIADKVADALAEVEGADLGTTMTATVNAYSDACRAAAAELAQDRDN